MRDPDPTENSIETTESRSHGTVQEPAETAEPRVLLVEDDQELAEVLARGLRRRGSDVLRVATAEAGLAKLRDQDFDVIITDIQMEGMDGLSFARRIVENRSSPVIVLTGHGNLDNAIGAIRAGVYDFIAKPVALDALEVAVQRAVLHKQMLVTLRRLRARADDADASNLGIIGDSRPIKELRKLIRRIAPVNISTLITGESGTGKELVARAIHEQSGRAASPFIAINCAALPEPLLESELFGHTKGAFTDARADRPGLFVEAKDGTILLDEIGEMPLSMQSKLLRALQEEKVRPVGGAAEVPIHARIIAATNRDLEQEVEDGNFREDLFYRLNVVGLMVPPLRQRGGDVLLLAQHFVDLFSEKLGRQVRGVSQAAAGRLMRYEWPGNVRELANCIERAVALTQFDMIMVEDLPESLSRYDAASAQLGTIPEGCTLEDLERLHIKRTLESMGGNKSRTAHALGIDRRTLYRKVRRYGLQD